MWWEKRLEALRANAVNFDDCRLSDLIAEVEELADRFGDALVTAEERIKDLEDEEDWYESDRPEDDDLVEDDE